jgi:hypothetical protein
MPERRFICLSKISRLNSSPPRAIGGPLLDREHLYQTQGDLVVTERPNFEFVWSASHVVR